MAAVSVKELKEILEITNPPCKLVDPKTELPLWDDSVMSKIRNATSVQEVIDLDPTIREIMVCFSQFSILNSQF